MNEFSDFQFDPAPSPPPSGPPRWQYTAVVMGGVALLAAAIVAVYLMQRGPAETVPIEASPVVEVTPPVDVPEIVDDVEPIELPELDESDSFVRDLVSALSAHPTLVTWIATDDLLRTFVVVVENMAEGQTPARHLGNLSPREPFSVTGSRQRPVVNPQSYVRYDLIADAFDSVNVESAVQLYAQLEPLLDDAFRDLGHPGGGFRQTLARAVREILDTPIVEGELVLVSRTVAFQFADASLEALAPVQRQALRMGPRNLRLVQQKLQELSVALMLFSGQTI
ncbi:MAG: DUF3014 domain-containing protein [Acidobacteriota bacterium]|nr:hypothetical protein [Acidobacteriota bacterium]MEC7768966.1 DUF3014 domain-containing protein [Acidobacteriota bacterium]